MRFTAAPTIFTPFIFDSCVCSRMARVTTGKIRPKEMESTVFMKVVFPIRVRISVALSMLALSTMLSMMPVDIARISGFSTRSWPMSRRKSSAAFFTSFLASPTAPLTAVITWGIMMPSCFGQQEGSIILFSEAMMRPNVATFTFHFPAAPAPRKSRSTGSTSSGTALPLGPASVICSQRSTAVPLGSDFSLVSSRRPRMTGRDGRMAGGFQSRARTVLSAKSRVVARFIFAEMRSVVLWTMLDTSDFTSLMYLMVPAPPASLVWASSLPSTALVTTATTSVSRSKGPASTSEGFAFTAAFLTGSSTTPFFFSMAPPSSWASRRFWRSSSSRSRT
mmetsp:Transcript_39546/g.117305  ORF Transcript_39546/g.117305 Transcript_39546/m.117305 type:complete len:335 (+) Transcript_39546:2925-3929(+)